MAERIKPPVSGERISFTPNLIGLQSRLLLGKTALNPSHHVAESFDPSGVPSFGARSYEVFEVNSDAERRSYWGARGIANVEEQIRVWSQSMSSLISNKSFSDSEKAFYNRLGIDTDNFSAQSAANFYQTNFAYNPDGIKSFVGTVINAHIDPDSGAFDYSDLMSNMDTITWLSHVFGAKSSDIVSQLVDAEVKLEINPEVFTHDPNRINNLTKRESEILGFVWQHHAGNKKVDNTPRKESGAYEIADRLIDYESGSVTEERVDLLPEYSRFVGDVTSKLENNHPLFQGKEPKLVLSDVAMAMIDRVASAANEKNGELAFTIKGNLITNNNKLVATGAYIVPASDFVNPLHAHVDTDPKHEKKSRRLLSRNTNLANYFLQSTGLPSGYNIGLLHIHQASLGEQWRIQPSDGDKETVENTLRKRGQLFYIWGVVTKSNNQLDMRVFFSSRNQTGGIDHTEIPVLLEADVHEEMPLAA